MMINKKNIIIIICIVLLSNTYITAQQTPVFSEYNYNPFIINNAYAGLTENTEITISNIGFFNSFEGSPRTFSLSGHGQINNSRIGVGAGFINDQIGVSKSLQFFTAFSYKIFFNSNKNHPYWQHYPPRLLSFGLTAGVQQYQNNLTELGIIEDSSFAQNINTSIPTIGFSFLFNYDAFYAGLSLPNIIGDTFANRDDLNLNSTTYGYLGYRFLTNRLDNIMIKPNILVKYEKETPVQTDLNVAVSFKNKFEIGAGYRTTSTFNLLAGFYILNGFRVIYNYNIATNNSTLGNTHGFILSFKFNEGYSL